MPKRVDHDERRRAIADALVRVAVREGLHATGFREVAAEAGVSVRLVQYYVETKRQLLLLAIQHVGARLGDRLPAPGDDVRENLEQVLFATMPLEAGSRELYVVYQQFFALSLTDDDLARTAFGDDAAGLERWIAGQITRLFPALDAEEEAATLVALAAGLGTGVLAGTRTPAQARNLLRGQLDRLARADALSAGG